MEGSMSRKQQTKKPTEFTAWLSLLKRSAYYEHILYQSGVTTPSVMDMLYNGMESNLCMLGCKDIEQANYQTCYLRTFADFLSELQAKPALSENQSLLLYLGKKEALFIGAAQWLDKNVTDKLKAEHSSTPDKLVQSEIISQNVINASDKVGMRFSALCDDLLKAATSNHSESVIDHSHHARPPAQLNSMPFITKEGLPRLNGENPSFLQETLLKINALLKKTKKVSLEMEEDPFFPVFPPTSSPPIEVQIDTLIKISLLEACSALLLDLLKKNPGCALIQTEKAFKKRYNLSTAITLTGALLTCAKEQIHSPVKDFQTTAEHARSIVIDTLIVMALNAGNHTAVQKQLINKSTSFMKAMMVKLPALTADAHIQAEKRILHNLSVLVVTILQEKNTLALIKNEKAIAELNHSLEILKKGNQCPAPQGDPLPDDKSLHAVDNRLKKLIAIKEKQREDQLFSKDLAAEVCRLRSLLVGRPTLPAPQKMIVSA